jgi:hypothetical protein
MAKRIHNHLRLHQLPIFEAVVDETRVGPLFAGWGQTLERSPINFLVNLVCGLIAYCHQPKKPSLQLNALPRMMLA